jgi:hypothetical protein
VRDPFGNGKRSSKTVVRRNVFGVSFSGLLSSGKSAASLEVTPTPLWTLFYDGYDDQGGFDFLNVLIHAVTGDVNPPLAYYTAARKNLDVANAAAVGWSADAQLVGVQSGNSNVHELGLSSDWTYTYRSPGSNTAHFFQIQEEVIIGEGPVGVFTLRSIQELPESWVDSPQATEAADAESGGFREQHQLPYVGAFLSRDIDFNNPTRPVWEFQYFDGASQDNLTVLIDATTGLVVGTEDEGELPSSVRLDQNYPNPFNPSTTISFEVPSAGSVRLSIFDVLGRSVRTLVDAERAAGRYVVTWDGSDDNGSQVSSGIYMYKLETGGASQTRSMTLLR